MFTFPPNNNHFALYLKPAINDEALLIKTHVVLVASYLLACSLYYFHCQELGE